MGLSGARQFYYNGKSKTQVLTALCVARAREREL